MQQIIDEFGQSYTIDETTKKLYLYSNKRKSATYSAEIVKDGKNSGFWTNYKSEEIVTDFFAKLKTFCSPVIMDYAKMVEYNATKRDPDNILWNVVVKYVKEHESDFFDKYGDFKKNVPDLLEVIPNWEKYLK